MSSDKNYLSQEEIDALLRQTAEDDDFMLDDAANSDLVTEISGHLSEMEQDALGEIGNITFGSAATALSTLLGQKVEITTPKLTIISHEDLEQEFPKPHVAISVNYVEGFQGINLLIIKTADAQVIADLMMGGDGMNVGGELNEIHLSAVQEAMNQMMGSSATSMSTIFNRFVNISPPGIDVFDLSTGQGTDHFPTDLVLVKVSFRLLIGDLIDSNIMQLLPLPFAKDLVSSLIGDAAHTEQVAAGAAVAEKIEPAPPVASAVPPQPAAIDPPLQPPMPGPVPVGPQPGQHAPYPPNAQAYPPAAMQQPEGYPQQMFIPPMQDFGRSMTNRNINVQPVQFGGFPGMPSMHAEQTNLNLLLDIPLRVTVELGRTQKTIKDILELSQGSIVELDKLAGEPVDILVNNKLIAKGEVVVIDENFGVRVTDIVSQLDRITKIQ